jgi:hypothetical protein
MTYLVTSNYEINKVAPPALPQAVNEYSRSYQDQLNNVLRLYFNQLDQIFNKFDSTNTVIPTLTVYTVATLPSAVTSSAGARAFVSDATATTFASTVAGGGANKVPVYSNGTDWKIG